MKDYRALFVGKKITLMGLGLLGRGVGDAQFLAECGADLIVTDLKTRTQLSSSIRKLSHFKNIKFILGEHRLEDFTNRDMIIKAAGVPLDSPFIVEARKNDIPIEMSTALFAELTEATIIGITGTRGKSTVTSLIYELLKQAGKKVYLGGNVKGMATLPLLEKVKKGDYVVIELDSWQLQGFGERKISPHIAVFSTFLSDHLNYYKGDVGKYFEDKANIFKYQKKGDTLVLGEQVAPAIKKKHRILKGRFIIASKKNVPKNWDIKIPGLHNRENIAIALEVARILKIPLSVVKKTVESFNGVPGRLELVRTYKGIKIYNDTTATTPDATIVALKALSEKKNIVLILGGADKDLPMEKLFKEIPKYVKTLVVLSGTGTERVKNDINALSKKTVKIINVSTLKEAVEKGIKSTQKGDILLLSPAFASFGPPPGGFKNEFDRGEQFNAIVKKSEKKNSQVS
ncbi:MAG: UDP-N-acetylmuramoyl-L-alanine--D-glutamate ligase [Patescibacteria group bacterium]